MKATLFRNAVIDDIEFKAGDIWFHFVSVDVIQNDDIVNFTIVIADNASYVIMLFNGVNESLDNELLMAFTPVVQEAMIPFIDAVVNQWPVLEMINAELEIISQNAEYFRTRLDAFSNRWNFSSIPSRRTY